MEIIVKKWMGNVTAWLKKGYVNFTEYTKSGSIDKMLYDALTTAKWASNCVKRYDKCTVIDIKRILTYLIDWRNTFRSPTLYYSSGKTITIASGTTYNSIVHQSITLPAYGRYLVLFRGGVGAVTGTVTNHLIGTAVTSGEASVNHSANARNTVFGGGDCCGSSYYQTENYSATIALRQYLYGAAGGKTTNAWMSAQVFRL